MGVEMEVGVYWLYCAPCRTGREACATSVFTCVDNVQLRDFGASGVRVMVTPHQILERQSKSCYRAYERIVLKSAEHVGTTDSASLAET